MYGCDETTTTSGNTSTERGVGGGGGGSSRAIFAYATATCDFLLGGDMSAAANTVFVALVPNPVNAPTPSSAAIRLRRPTAVGPHQRLPWTATAAWTDQQDGIRDHRGAELGD